MEGWLETKCPDTWSRALHRSLAVPFFPGLSTGSQAMTHMSGPFLEPCNCFIRLPLMKATVGCLQAQLNFQHHFIVPWFDQKTLGVFYLLAPKVASTS